MVRAGEGGYYVNKFRETKTVGIGWNEVGDLSSVQQDDVRARVNDVWQGYSNNRLGAYTGQLVRFRFEFSIGDHIVTYDPSERKYLLGAITSDYEFSKDKDSPYRHVRNVDWMADIQRDLLSVKTKNQLGAAQTIIEIGHDQRSDILNIYRGESPGVKENIVEELVDLGKDVEEQASEFIKDRLSKLDSTQMEELVAGLLRGMGYKTRVSPHGPDQGRDIEASPDGLGYTNPRIIVEVKHRKGRTKAPDVRQLSGILNTDDRGLYVSTGGFSREAHYEAKRSNVPLVLVDFDRLVSLIIQYYEDFDSEARSLLPLRRIYWPDGVSE